jgi:hypothetical protein
VRAEIHALERAPELSPWLRLPLVGDGLLRAERDALLT